MKLVINKCHGGFGLSPRAMVDYYKRKGRNCFFYDGGLGEPWKRITPEEAEARGLFWTSFDKPDMPVEFSDDEYKKHYLDTRIENRADPDLVEVVKRLADAANGRFAKLRVVEIPDDVEYTIEEYDGSEWVAEKHRTWH